MIRRLARARLYRRQPVVLLLRDLVGRRGPLLDRRVHLEEAARWLLRAQAATQDDGVAAAYSFEEGWVGSYPETTGYIIPTLLAYAERVDSEIYRKAALAMAEWELTVQTPEGGFPGHFVDRAHPPVVFNTGQVIFGLVAAHAATGDDRFLDAAHRAGHWLVGAQDPDGAWRRSDYRGALHVYNTRYWEPTLLGEIDPAEVQRLLAQVGAVPAATADTPSTVRSVRADDLELLEKLARAYRRTNPVCTADDNLRGLFNDHGWPRLERILVKQGVVTKETRPTGGRQKVFLRRQFLPEQIMAGADRAAAVPPGCRSRGPPLWSSGFDTRQSARW